MDLKKIHLAAFAAPLVLGSSDFFEMEDLRAEQSTSTRRMKHVLAEPLRRSPMGTYVGELREKWQFPSDHLPIGMRYGDHNIMSWNVLDSKYINWVIEKDSQGLDGSLISDEHVYIDGKLTVRDEHVVRNILSALEHPQFPKNLIALQECNGAFIRELKKALPKHYKVIHQRGQALIVNTERFQILEAKSVAGVYSEQPTRTFQSVDLRDLRTGEDLRIINVHIPGDPEGIARYDLAEYLAKQHALDEDVSFLVMGDMNFNETEMFDAFKKALKDERFSLLSCYPTNVSPRALPDGLHSKAIDHFILIGNKEQGYAQRNPEHVMPNLSETVNLLKK